MNPMTHPPIKAPFELPQTEAAVEVAAGGDLYEFAGVSGAHLDRNRGTATFYSAKQLQDFAALAAQAGAVQAVGRLPFAILPDELAALHRFYETTEDGQDYDVPEPMMKRLAVIGLVRRVTGNRYEFTDFGLSVRNGDFSALAATQPSAAPGDGQVTDWAKMEALGWQRITCPVCGDIARAAPGAAIAAREQEIRAILEKTWHTKYSDFGAVVGYLVHPSHVDRLIAALASPAAAPTSEGEAAEHVSMAMPVVGTAPSHQRAIYEAPTSQPNAAAQEQQAEMSPEFTDTARAALLWVLWHHQGASSKVGQPIRFALGMGQFDRLNERQISEAKRWAEMEVTAAQEQQAGRQVVNAQCKGKNCGTTTGDHSLECLLEHEAAYSGKRALDRPLVDPEFPRDGYVTDAQWKARLTAAQPKAIGSTT